MKLKDAFLALFLGAVGAGAVLICKTALDSSKRGLPLEEKIAREEAKMAAGTYERKPTVEYEKKAAVTYKNIFKKPAPTKPAPVKPKKDLSMYKKALGLVLAGIYNNNSDYTGYGEKRLKAQAGLEALKALYEEEYKNRDNEEYIDNSGKWLGEDWIWKGAGGDKRSGNWWDLKGRCRYTGKNGLYWVWTDFSSGVAGPGPDGRTWAKCGSYHCRYLADVKNGTYDPRPESRKIKVFGAEEP